MYILKLGHQIMTFTEKKCYKESSDLEAFLRFNGIFDGDDIKKFILDSLKVAEGNPIQVINLDEDLFLECIEQLGLKLSNENYLHVPYLGIKQHELTAVKLLRDGYSIKFNYSNNIIVDK